MSAVDVMEELQEAIATRAYLSLRKFSWGRPLTLDQGSRNQHFECFMLDEERFVIGASPYPVALLACLITIATVMGS